MIRVPDSGSLRRLQSEIERFLASLGHPIVVEDEMELFDLTAAQWKLSVEFGKLLFEAWNAARSIGRRIEDIAYRDRDRLGIFVRKPGARETATLEFRELELSRRGAARPADRGRAGRELLAVLGRSYPACKFERVSHSSDREHSFSTWYTRGLARQGRTAWAFLGLSEDEGPAAADSVLAYGLIWLDWLRAHSDRLIVPGLKFFLPRAALQPIAHRVTCLDHRALQVEIFEWRPGDHDLAAIDLKDYGNVETELAPRRQAEMLLERHGGFLRELTGDLYEEVDVVPGSSATFLSVRVKGLEVARLEGQVSPRVSFGLEGSARPLDPTNRPEFREFLRKVIETRKARSPDRKHEFYRLQAERWLESLLLGDISRIDPALQPRFVYPQVPAFAGIDRGVIDILGAAQTGRLSVIELKVEEEINLPFQGLDYWLRVKWLAERSQFQERGYFPGVALGEASPLLYLVSPAFRFHSTTGRLIRYLAPAIELTQVGLNDRWREKVKVLFRRRRSEIQ